MGLRKIAEAMAPLARVLERGAPIHGFQQPRDVVRRQDVRDAHLGELFSGVARAPTSEPVVGVDGGDGSRNAVPVPVRDVAPVTGPRATRHHGLVRVPVALQATQP